MKRTGVLVRLTVALIAAMALTGTGTASAQSEGETSVTIHKSSCPENTGSDIFERCHDNGLAGIDFNISGTDVTTNGKGHATAEVEAGSVTITENPSDADDFKGAYVFCSEQGSGKILTDGRVNDGSVTITTEDGDEVICDWYNLTAAVVTSPTVGPGPTKTATAVPVHPTKTPSATYPTATPGITLPNTGAGDREMAGGSNLWIAGVVLIAGAALFSIRRRRVS